MANKKYELPYTVAEIHGRLDQVAENTENISQLSEEIANYLPKFVGTDKVGKIAIVGTDGYITWIDMPEGGVSGDVVGVLDEANNILLTGNLADGTYTLKYEYEDGTVTEIGTLEVGEIVPEEPSLIPDDYQQVEWLQIGNVGTVNSGIKTDLTWSGVTKIFTKLQNVDSTNARDVIISTWATETTKTSPYIRTNRAELYAEGNGLTNYSITPSDLANTDTNANEVTMTFTATSTGIIFIGGWNDDQFSNPHKWYFIEFYNGDELVGNFIPCYRKSDSVSGMYDVVSGTFYENAESDANTNGNFGVGSDV